MDKNDNSRVMESYTLYMKKLAEAGVETKGLSEKYGTAIMNGSYASRNDAGLAYRGSLTEVSMRGLTAYAVRINELLPQEVRCPRGSVVKVGLLQHISNAVRMAPCSDEWKRSRQGIEFDFIARNAALGTGAHSILMATECGITFTTEEFEAMMCIDKGDDDKQAKFYSGTLTSVIRCANEMVYAEANKKNNIVI